MNQQIELYTDGSSVPNPGPSGWAYLIRYHTMKDGHPHTEVIEQSKGFRASTNNRMEVLAGIEGVEAILTGISSGTYLGSQVKILSDSEYFCNSVNKGWVGSWASNNWMTKGGFTFKDRQGNERVSKPKEVANRDLWERWIDLTNRARAMAVNISIEHIYGHTGHTWNERCDVLSKEAATAVDSYQVDSIYENSRGG